MSDINIQPLNDYLVVEVLKNENEGGGVLLPDTHKKEEYGIGVVLAVNHEEENPIQVIEGDKVVFDKYLLISVKIKGKDVKFLKSTDILGIIKEDINVID